MATPVRRLSTVRVSVWLVLALGLAGQLFWHHSQPESRPQYQALPRAPADGYLKIAALGEEPLLARVLMLWLQARDTQPGISVPLKQLDYAKLRRWLAASLSLDPRTQYPLLVATRIYAAVSDPQRVRLMLDFVHQQFLRAPNQRWRWMAETSLMARHRLHDLPLATFYSRELTARATSKRVPNWARDMSVLQLADADQFEAAFRLTAQLIKDGRITDPHEIKFLEKQLDELQSQARKVKENAGIGAEKGAKSATQ